MRKFLFPPGRSNPQTLAILPIHALGGDCKLSRKTLLYLIDKQNGARLTPLAPPMLLGILDKLRANRL
ncbi:MAG: hypothetical protein D6680_22290 [Cyanobacteria bacterium J007]|nr:MAG: hypothetical protein D6680_22290 [Cyanobacteria bacterium J007]